MDAKTSTSRKRRKRARAHGKAPKHTRKKIIVPIDNPQLEIVSPEPQAYLEPTLLKPLAICTVLLYVWLWTMMRTMPRLRRAAFASKSVSDKAVLVGHLLATASVGVLALNLLQAFGFTLFSDPQACVWRCQSKSCGHLVRASRGETRKVHIDRNGYMWEVRANVAKSDGDEPLSNECLLTPWSVTHMFCYLTAGFLAPKVWYLSLGASVAWEVAEYQANAHDWLDIFINMSSIGTGMLIRRALYGPDKGDAGRG